MYTYPDLAQSICYMCDAGRCMTVRNTVVLCIVIFITGMIVVVTFMIVVLYGKH